MEFHGINCWRTWAVWWLRRKDKAKAIPILFFENEEIGLLCLFFALAAQPVSRMNGVNEAWRVGVSEPAISSARRNEGVSEAGWVGWLSDWVGYARCQRHGSAQEERTPTNNSTNSRSSAVIHFIPWAALFSSFLFKRNERKRKRRMKWNDERSTKLPAAARQAHSATLLFVGPLCALKKEDNCWNGMGPATLFINQMKTKKV